MHNFTIENKLKVSQELKSVSFRYHTIITWVAFLLNPIWAISDYLNASEHFLEFLIFRISISLISLSLFFTKNRFSNHPEILALIPFLGILIQNAYMYSVMDISALQKHTFAYVALFIGAGMLILWKPIYSIIVIIISFLANVLFIALNSKLTVNEILSNGGLLVITVALFMVFLIYLRTNLTKKEIHQLEISKNTIEEKNKDINDSINYALRIQQAIFPPIEKINANFKDYFILFQPKDIVSGDFYWFNKVQTTHQDGLPNQEVVVFAAVDCTGHGVPGALMSIIGNTILNQSLKELNVNSPAEALQFLDSQLANNMHSINDGMDIALCSINQSTLKLEYAGANNSLYIIRNKELIEIKADKKPIGGADSTSISTKTFTNHSIQLEKDDCIYLFTDGFADQFGGTKGKKLKYKNFQELLLKFNELNMDNQKDALLNYFNEWKGNLDQTDDVLVIGVRI
jgi:sigma-B regulation protein RsbU (phosphoserine phosphatase)